MFFGWLDHQPVCPSVLNKILIVFCNCHFSKYLKCVELNLGRKKLNLNLKEAKQKKSTLNV
jgi:hypothetical protein